MRRFKNILYVNEPTLEPSSTVARVVALAKRNRAKLTIMEIIPSSAESGRQDRTAERERHLASLLAPHRQDLKADVAVVAGTLFLEVIRAVLRNEHDLVTKHRRESPNLKTTVRQQRHASAAQMPMPGLADEVAGKGKV